MPETMAAAGGSLPRQQASLREAIDAVRSAVQPGRGGSSGNGMSARAHVETGDGAIDATLGGGLMRGAIHEILPRTPQDMTAAAGFACALAARAHEHGAHTLFIQHDFTQAENGRPYLPGLHLAGLDTAHLVYLHVPRAEDVLWAMNEALSCRGFSTVIAEFPPQARVLDLTSTRRLTLAAQAGLGFGLILRNTISVEPNAATTRWLVAPRPTRTSRHGGIGAPNFHLDLVKNRRGPSGQWQVEWLSNERKLAVIPATPVPAIQHAIPAALHVGMAQPPAVRPHRAPPLARAG